MPFAARSAGDLRDPGILPRPRHCTGPGPYLQLRPASGPNDRTTTGPTASIQLKPVGDGSFLSMGNESCRRNLSQRWKSKIGIVASPAFDKLVIRRDVHPKTLETEKKHDCILFSKMSFSSADLHSCSALPLFSRSALRVKTLAKGRSLRIELRKSTKQPFDSPLSDV